MSKEMREQIDRVKNWKQFLNENKYSENEVVSFINKKMLEDKKEYRGHIPTKYNKGSEWSDFSWLVDEIHNFLQNEWTTSYILREFSDKYDTDTLKEIVRNNFKQEYEYVYRNMNMYEMRRFINKFSNFNKQSNIWVHDFKKENPHIKETLIPLSFLYDKIKKWDNEHYEKNIWDREKVNRMVVVKAELFPPVVLEKNTNNDEYVVIDGWHRLSAAEKRGDSEIKALIKNVGS